MKLNKLQAQAVINKLGREYSSLRDTLIEEEHRKYKLSDTAKELRRIYDIKDKAKVALQEAENAIRDFLSTANITGIYSYTSMEEALKKIKDSEIENKYPKLDLGAALDDLIIESVDEDFNVDAFIDNYLARIKR